MRLPVLAFWILMGCSADIQVPGTPLTLEEMMDPQACKDCHPKHYEQWSGSMHAYAAEDPIFRAMNAKGQKETDGALGDFCIKCHAPVAVELGLTVDGLNMDDIPKKFHGVTCYFCHQVTEVNGTHNNPLKLAMDTVMRGGIADPVANQAHGMAYSEFHDRDRLQESSKLCGACHDIVTPANVHLERTFAEWKDTLFAHSHDPVNALSCGDCHMEGRRDVAADAPGVSLRTVHDHSMPGVDIALTDWPHREVQRQRVQAALDSSLISDICVYPSAEETRILLSLENIAAGHGFPSGASQDRRVWVEVTAMSGGDVVFQSGHVPDGVALADHKDPSRWQFGDDMFDTEGKQVHMFWEAATVQSSVLPAPTETSPIQEGFIDTHKVKDIRIPETGIDRINMKIHVRPMRLDTLDELIADGYLAESIKDQIPTFTLATSNITWTPDLDRPCFLPPN